VAPLFLLAFVTLHFFSPSVFYNHLILFILNKNHFKKKAAA